MGSLVAKWKGASGPGFRLNGDTIIRCASKRMWNPSTITVGVAGSITTTTIYYTQLALHIITTKLLMSINLKIVGITLDQKLKHYPDNTTTKTPTTRHIPKASTTWRKQMETILATYKPRTRPIVESPSTILSPLVSDTNIFLNYRQHRTSDTELQQGSHPTPTHKSFITKFT